MDYSLLLITEENPDFQEPSQTASVGGRFKSVKTVASSRDDKAQSGMLKRQLSGLVEVDENLEEDGQASEHPALLRELDAGPREAK